MSRADRAIEEISAAIDRALNGSYDAQAVLADIKRLVEQAECVVDHDHLYDGSTSDGLDCHPSVDA